MEIVKIISGAVDGQVVLHSAVVVVRAVLRVVVDVVVVLRVASTVRVALEI